MDIERWTGREARLLREALRMSVRAYAAHLGVAPRTVSRWELHGSDRTPHPELQQALDTVLRRAAPDVRRRFDLMLTARPPAPPDQPSGGRSRVDPTQIDALVDLLRDQWHLLVKTDNLFGPRWALRGVLDQLDLIEQVITDTPPPARAVVIGIAAQYAESASWLHEDLNDLHAAHHWNTRAGTWAREAGDRPMLAWSQFRRSQQALTAGRPGEALALATDAVRQVDLRPITRAAITQQMAHSLAVLGEEPAAHRHLDQAHAWAGHDDSGDARSGHGAFCTPAYLELQRASCWLTLNRPGRAIALYEEVLPRLAPVYRRDRGRALGKLALAHAVSAHPDSAAHAAQEALTIARATGSRRTEQDLHALSHRLRAYRKQPVVAGFLDELEASPS